MFIIISVEHVNNLMELVFDNKFNSFLVRTCFVVSPSTKLRCHETRYLFIARSPDNYVILVIRFGIVASLPLNQDYLMCNILISQWCRVSFIR